MTVIVFEVEVGANRLQGVIDSMQPKLLLDEQPFTSIEKTVKTLPELNESKNYIALAQTINFLARGLEFRVIDDIDEFKTTYKGRVQEEMRHPEYGPPLRLTDYGIFDISVLSTPQIQDGIFKFFVENDYNGLPYQVTLSYPVHDQRPQIRYELLPYMLGQSPF